MQGGALTLLGLGLAPFTAGGSLALTGVSMAASVAGGGILVTSAAFSVPGEVVAHQWEKHYIAKSADEAKSVMLHCQVGGLSVTCVSSTGCPICSRTWVGLALFWVLQPLLPNFHQPRQN